MNVCITNLMPKRIKQINLGEEIKSYYSILKSVSTQFLLRSMTGSPQ
jgi:hypothetical protein